MEHGLGLVLVWTLASAAAVGPEPDVLLVHTVTLLDSLSDLFESGSRSDLTLRVQTPEQDLVEILPVHSLVLTIHSPVFGHMIQSRKSDILEIHESPDTVRVFSKFIRFLYSGSVSIVQQEALALLSLARRFNVSALGRSLSEHMTRSLAHDWPGRSVTSWLEWAWRSEEAGLRDRWIEALALNLRLISEDLVSFSPDLVLALVSRSDLVLDSELDLFLWVQTWIQTNEPDGLTAENLLRSVRYAMIPPEELFRIQTQSSVLVRYQDSVRDLLFLSFQFHSGSARTLGRFLDLNCSLFVPRVYLSPDWGQAWTLRPDRDQSLTIRTQLGPSGSDRSKPVLWSLQYWPQRRSLSPGVLVQTSPEFRPRVQVSRDSAGPDPAGVQFQKSLLVVGPGNCVQSLCSFHHSSSESPDCLQVRDLDKDLDQNPDQDQLRVHVVIRPIYTRLD